MSFNVYLALFRGWTAQRMRSLEWKYFVACYGCAFVPALVFLFVKTDKRGKIYGPAVVSNPHPSSNRVIFSPSNFIPLKCPHCLV